MIEKIQVIYSRYMFGFRIMPKDTYSAFSNGYHQNGGIKRTSDDSPGSQEAGMRGSVTAEVHDYRSGLTWCSFRKEPSLPNQWGDYIIVALNSLWSEWNTLCLYIAYRMCDCCLLVFVNTLVPLSALPTACHPYWDRTLQIFTFWNTGNSLDVLLQRSMVNIIEQSHLLESYCGVFCVAHVHVTCYSRHVAVGGRRWW